jgi:probable F420-dependent oxidoreductase
MGNLRWGAMFPGDCLQAFGRDTLDEWLSQVVQLGFDHVVFGDHVVGVDPVGLHADEDAAWRSDFPGQPEIPIYTVANRFPEVLVTFGYLAGQCDLELVAGVLVLPQRQTTLVAKQCAEVDLLCGGRLRLGCGLGWSSHEFEAMGADFRQRGRRLEEQISLLRLLWTRETVSFEGQFHRIRSCGLQALPHQRPIPIWLGGQSSAAVERVGSVGDGWFPPPMLLPGSPVEDCIGSISRAAERAGRSTSEIGIEPRIMTSSWEGDALGLVCSRWVELGATHLCLDTRRPGLRTTVADHRERLIQAARAAGVGNQA